MINMVAAMARNRVIGHKGKLPWGHNMPRDIRRYSDLIRGRTIVMGSKTYAEADHSRSESAVTVLSRKPLLLPDGVGLVNSASDVIAMTGRHKEIFVTGGGEVFQLMLEHADRIFLTIVEHEFEGDVFFPDIDAARWELLEKRNFKKDGENKYDYSFLTYEARDAGQSSGP